METRAFGIDYQTDTPEFTFELRERVRRRLEKLGRGAQIVGAEIGVHALTGAPQQYRVRIVLRTNGTNPTVVEKGSLVPVALSKALESLERQVRDRGKKRVTTRRRAVEPGAK